MPAPRNSAAGTGGVASPAGHALSITRVLDAPRSLVFKAWTRPEHLARWWGPRDYTAVSFKMDLRPGGAYRACIRSPAGQDSWMSGTYREVVEPERLVFTFAWEAADGTPKHQTLVTVTFAEAGGRTRLNFHQAVFETTADRDSHVDGWSQCLDRLVTYLETM